MKVIFLKKDGDIYALFYQNRNINNDMILCYSHIGQHSECHKSYATSSIICTYNELQPLYQELKIIYPKIELSIYNEFYTSDTILNNDKNLINYFIQKEIQRDNISKEEKEIIALGFNTFNFLLKHTNITFQDFSNKIKTNNSSLQARYIANVFHQIKGVINKEKIFISN